MLKSLCEYLGREEWKSGVSLLAHLVLVSRDAWCKRCWEGMHCGVRLWPALLCCHQPWKEDGWNRGRALTIQIQHSRVYEDLRTLLISNRWLIDQVQLYNKTRVYESTVFIHFIPQMCHFQWNESFWIRNKKVYSCELAWVGEYTIVSDITYIRAPKDLFMTRTGYHSTEHTAMFFTEGPPHCDTDQHACAVDGTAIGRGAAHIQSWWM